MINLFFSRYKYKRSYELYQIFIKFNTALLTFNENCFMLYFKEKYLIMLISFVG